MSRFETEACSRCNGTGNYSFNMMTGTRCFKCRGAKVTITKRGAAASAFFFRSMETPAEQIKAGMLVWTSGASISSPNKWREVMVVGQSTSSMIVDGVTIPGIGLSFAGHELSLSVGRKLPAARDTEQLKQKLDAALIYQSGLTKTGKPAKKAA